MECNNNSKQVHHTTLSDCNNDNTDYCAEKQGYTNYNSVIRKRREKLVTLVGNVVKIGVANKFYNF